jgi:hypothetical protein
MIVALEIAATDGATFTVGNSTASRPPRSWLSAWHGGRAFAHSAAFVVAGAVIWLVALAIITLASEGLHANWS